MMTVEHLPFAAAKATVCLAQTATRGKSNQMTSATMASSVSRVAAQIAGAQILLNALKHAKKIATAQTSLAAALVTAPLLLSFALMV
jgi:hypothetical protein